MGVGAPEPAGNTSTQPQGLFQSTLDMAGYRLYPPSQRARLLLLGSIRLSYLEHGEKVPRLTYADVY